MKKKIIWGSIFVFLIVVSILAMMSDEPIDKSIRNVDVKSYLKKREMIADLDSLVATFEKIHPNPYRFKAKEQRIAIIEAIKKDLPDSLSTIHFWRIVNKIVCSYTDAHSYVYSSYVRNDYIEKGGLFFPLSARVENDKIIISENKYSDQVLPKGTEIQKINGYVTKELINVLVQYGNRETRELNLLKISENFGYYLWKAFDWSSNFNIHYQLQNDLATIDSLTLKGIDWKELSEDNIDEKPSYTFDFLKDTLGYMRISDFNGNRGEINSFYQESFQQIKEKGIKHLILDFRGHTGGTDQYGEDLAKYFAKKPFRKMSKAFWKITPEFKEAFDRRFVPKGIRWFKPIYLINEYSEVFYGAKQNKIVTIEYEFKSPLKKEKQFEGNVFLITDHNTFSAGSIFAEMFKYFDMGTIVGQPTGNLYSFNGFALVEYVLPNSKLCFQLSSVYNLSNNEEEGLKSVEPNIFIEKSEDPLDYIIDNLID